MNSFNRFFELDRRSTNVKTEIVAGITTFLTMAYILAVNPSIFSATTMDTGAVFTSTALAAIIGTLVMSLYAKMPFALAPGMGLNAFFVYTVVLNMGYSWEFALTAVFIEGLIFLALTLTNVREAMINAIPMNLKHAIGCGIGLYVAFIGLKNAGIIIHNDSTLVSIGDLTDSTSVITVFGIILIGILLIKHVKSAILFGILVCTAIAFFTGDATFNGIMSTPKSIAPIFCKFQFKEIWSLDFLIVLFTFMCVDMFDTIGTFIGICDKSNLIEKDGTIKNVKKALCADSIATIAGALLGTSTTTTYVESASGVSEGGRSGLTSFVVAVCFAIALFFAPLFLSIPSCATAPALVVVGLYMISPIKKINFDDFSEGLPAFITILAMPLCYSISDGIMTGVITYVVLNLLTGGRKKITPMMYILAVIFIAKYIFL